MTEQQPGPPSGSATPIVRPPDDRAPRGADEVEHGWGDRAVDRSEGSADSLADAAARRTLERHRAERPPHHDSDWG